MRTTLNPTAGSSPILTVTGSGGTGGTGGTRATGATGGSGGTGGQTTPLPGAYHELTGCANPNTGVASGDWEVATILFYTPVGNSTPVVGMPVYASNTIFWTSRENAPGQSILLTGAFTDATKTARIAVIPPGTMDWQHFVHASKSGSSDDAAEHDWALLHRPFAVCCRCLWI